MDIVNVEFCKVVVSQDRSCVHNSEQISSAGMDNETLSFETGEGFIGCLSK